MIFTHEISELNSIIAGIQKYNLNGYDSERYKIPDYECLKDAISVITNMITVLKKSENINPEAASSVQSTYTRVEQQRSMLDSDALKDALGGMLFSISKIRVAMFVTTNVTPGWSQAHLVNHDIATAIKLLQEKMFTNADKQSDMREGAEYHCAKSTASALIAAQTGNKDDVLAAIKCVNLHLGGLGYNDPIKKSLSKIIPLLDEMHAAKNNEGIPSKTL
ncbi:MAG: hypothetical protein WC748_03850 [Legionellales bacterium]|jgi:hypothetical protein